MLTRDQMQAASDLLYGHWQAGTRLLDLPAGLRPGSRADGYGIQGFTAARSAQPLFGWKIAATSAGGQAHVQVDGPLAGRILAETVLAEGAPCPMGDNLMQVAELEFAFRIGRDLPARPAPYTVDEVMAAVDTLHPAIEVPDTRFQEFTRVGAAQLIADNACTHRFLLGRPAPDGWRGTELAAHAVRGGVAGTPERQGSGANVLGDPRQALTWLANELAQHGLGLAAGQVVTTGTCVVPIEIAAGDRVWGDFGTLGQIELALTE